MSNSAYWENQLNYYKNNRPPKPESYYNVSFVQKINEARKNIDNLVSEKNKSWSASEQARSDYNAFEGSMSTYDEVYKQSKSEFGIEQHYENYEKSKKAIALAESTLSALPSSINASSNRVLTQEQRESRYNTLADKFMVNRDTMAKNTSAYEDVWKNAREAQSAYVQSVIADQWSKLDDFNNSWLASLDEYTAAARRLTEGRSELRQWESQYRDWQSKQWENANAIWYKNYESALDRYIDARETDRTIRETEMDKYWADRDAQRNYEAQQRKEKLAKGLVDSYYKSKKAKSDVYQKYLGLPSLNWH